MITIHFTWLLGRGLFATMKFDAGEFMCTYIGGLCYKKNMLDIENKYEQEQKGSYVFDFIYKGANMW